MKTKLVILALLSAFSINVSAKSAANGQLSVGYATESYFRGSQISEDAVELQVSANGVVNGLDVFADVLSVQSNEGTDTDFATIGLGKQINDLVTLYGGLININPEGASSQLDAFISANLDLPLSPSVSVYRDTDDDLYTYEASISKTFDVGFAELDLGGSLGNTDLAAGGDRHYGGVTAQLKKKIDNVCLHAGVSLIDVEDLDVDTVVSAGVTFKF